MRNCPYAAIHGCGPDIEPEECLMCPLRPEERPSPWELEDDYVPPCGTCGTPLAYEGPRACDAYCSDRCYDTASAAADEAADNRYI
jgi:hypothetical protein